MARSDKDGKGRQGTGRVECPGKRARPRTKLGLKTFVLFKVTRVRAEYLRWGLAFAETPGVADILRAGPMSRNVLASGQVSSLEGFATGGASPRNWLGWRLSAWLKIRGPGRRCEYPEERATGRPKNRLIVGRRS